MQQWTSFVNLNQAIIKKSLKRVDLDCVSFSALDSSENGLEVMNYILLFKTAWYLTTQETTKLYRA